MQHYRAFSKTCLLALLHPMLCTSYSTTSLSDRTVGLMSHIFTIQWSDIVRNLRRSWWSRPADFQSPRRSPVFPRFGWGRCLRVRVKCTYVLCKWSSMDPEASAFSGRGTVGWVDTEYSSSDLSSSALLHNSLNLLCIAWKNYSLDCTVCFLIRIWNGKGGNIY